jgi:hypothetical protein
MRRSDASLKMAEDLLLSAQARHALGQRDAARADAAAAQRHAQAAAGAEHPLADRARSESLRQQRPQTHPRLAGAVRHDRIGRVKAFIRT